MKNGNTKYYLIFGIIILLVLVFYLGYFKSSNICEPNYIIDEEHELNEDNLEDMEILRRYGRDKICLNGNAAQEIWIQELDKYSSDPSYEKIIYCEKEDKFLVVKGLGIAGAKDYFFEGRPCK